MRERFVTYFRLSSVHAKCTLFAWILLAGGFAMAGDAEAQTELSKSGAWKAYTYSEGGKLTCYMYSQPTKKEGNYKKRGDPHAMVTRRRGSKVVEEVSITSGYPYKDKTPIKVKIDGRGFKFGIVQEEHVWADDAAEDKKIVKAMIRGNKLTVRGTSRKDTYSLDSYSLKGFSKTHKAIVKACP
ncbi:MAG: hypothetical protein HOM52_18325 [Rhodospirillaceae bacterium]|jgi:hypothetical protein|nr:hypothetical protein [Rhodospirillaceae bacterium]MBT4425555.1 hypothetical protein [Rhodospirillaceae bacterium]MBT5040466.1 hypothetical protein [Rhodospirillaceae bacterium]MBT6829705.1 hypothetical protein [Rhodospirillaceae bacterium]MBT7294540.1 hypothetical protein [Rhodospirillaceae bacterium]